MLYPPSILPNSVVIPPLNPALLHPGPNVMIHDDVDDVQLTAADVALLQAPRLGTQWTLAAMHVLQRHYRLFDEPINRLADRKFFVRFLFLGRDE